MGLGMMVTINQQIDAETAEIVASEFKCKVNIVSLFEETIVECEKGDDEDIMERPPIVTVMGHVDHGKTKLLDAIKSSDIAASEHGGITQHIGAYKVDVDGKSIVFLDTPGHEAFTLMRARGAQVTDIVVLVVAANDGVMPQTVEAINHAKEAKVPIIVAVNKVDLPDANPDRVKQQLSEYNLIPEDWGGSTIFTEISALKRMGIENLLENILLQSELLELKANPNCRAEGKIIESKVDHGRGIVSTVLIERGTLKVGDAFIAGVYPGKVRAMFNDIGEKIETATPATPVEITGFTGIPNAGDPFQVTENEKYARQIGEKRQELEKIGVAKNVKKVTLDNLYDSIQDGEIQELKAIIKGDVQGSVEALKIALEKLSTSDIRLNVIHASAGAIIENDVNLASASNAVIVGFHVRPTPKAQMLADQEKVEIKKYNIIYDAVEDIKTSLEGMLAPELKEETIGTVEVRDIFKVPKIGVIAGCYVTSGKVKRGGIAHLYRDNVDIFNGKISSLKRFKDDAKEVDKGYECGIGLENFTDIQAGDIIEIVEIKEISKKLDG
jgi:translation initiation factor IF-2